MRFGDWSVKFGDELTACLVLYPAVQIDKAHAALTAAYPLQSRKLTSTEDAESLKEQCKAFDKLMPFETKHGLQNASIVGELPVSFAAVSWDCWSSRWAVPCQHKGA